MDDHGRVLLLRRPSSEELGPGLWNLPGGAIDPGEGPLEAAHRELAEETGLTATYAGFDTVFTFPGGRGMAYLFRHPQGEVAIAPREVDEAQWFYPVELPALTLAGTVEAVHALVGKGRAPMGELTLTSARLRLEAWAGRAMLPWLTAHVMELASAKGLVLQKSVGDDAAGEEAMFKVLVRAMKMGRSEAAAALRKDASRGVTPPGRELTPGDLSMLRTIARRNVRLVKATTERALLPIALQAQAATVQTMLTKLYDMTRSNLIGADLVSKGYANGVIDVLKANGYRYIFWRTMEDERVCAECGPLNNTRLTIRQFLKRAPLHPRCFTAGHMITTDRGDVPIEAIVAGDRVLTHEGRFMPVERTRREAVKGQGYRIVTTSGKVLTVTGEHPFLTQRGWVEARSLRSDDSLWELEAEAGTSHA